MPLPKKPVMESKYDKKRKEILARYEKENKRLYYRVRGFVWAFQEGDDEAKRFHNDLHWIENLMKFFGGNKWSATRGVPDLIETIEEVRYYFPENNFFYALMEDEFFVEIGRDTQDTIEFIEKLKKAILEIRNNFCDSTPLSTRLSSDMHPALKELKRSFYV